MVVYLSTQQAQVLDKDLGHTWPLGFEPSRVQPPANVSLKQEETPGNIHTSPSPSQRMCHSGLVPHFSSRRIATPASQLHTVLYTKPVGLKSGMGEKNGEVSPLAPFLTQKSETLLPLIRNKDRYTSCQKQIPNVVVSHHAPIVIAQKRPGPKAIPDLPPTTPLERHSLCIHLFSSSFLGVSM